MNKKILTLAVLGATATAAHAQSSVTLYGLIDAGVSYVNHTGGYGKKTGKEFEYQDGAASGTRWGMRGVEDLGNGLKAVFTLEGGFNSGTGSSNQGGNLFGRQAFVGLAQDGVGQVTFGRQYSFSTDILGAKYANGGNSVAGNWAYHFSDIDQLASSRINNAVKFTSANFNGLTFGALYGFSNTSSFAGGPVGSGTASSRAYSFGANYENGPFGLGAAYTDITYPGQTYGSSTLFTSSLPVAGTATAVGNLKDLRTFGVGGKFTYGPATAWALWTNTRLEPLPTLGLKNMVYNAFDAGAKYALTPALSLQGNYTYSRVSDSVSGHWNQFTGAVDYSLSKRTDVYVEGSYEKASGHLFESQIGLSSSAGFAASGTGSKNQIAARVGLRTRF